MYLVTICFKRTNSSHYTLYLEPPKHNLQIPRGQGLHGEDGLYEEVKDTRYSGLPPLCIVIITGMPSLFYIGVGKRKGKLDGYFSYLQV